MIKKSLFSILCVSLLVVLTMMLFLKLQNGDEDSMRRGSERLFTGNITTVTPTAIIPSIPFPDHYFAPYLEIATYGSSFMFNLAEMKQKTGIRFYTIGFVMNGGHCRAVWGETGIPITQGSMLKEIQALRSGSPPGDIIISFGGGGDSELAQQCSVSDLQQQYQAVIDQYQVSHLDFDIEGEALLQDNNHAMDKRNQALYNIQQVPRNQGLSISYTLPVGPYGLDDPNFPNDMFTQAKRLLENAWEHHVQVDRVNLMTMNYGDYPTRREMGDDAIRAASSVHQYLRDLFFSTDDLNADEKAWAMIGMTPMIGRNDVGDQIFTLDDAQTVLDFAAVHQIGLLSMWSIQRDQQCQSQKSFQQGKEDPVSHASMVCSDSLNPPWKQPVPYAFSAVFNQFTPVPDG